MPPTAESRTVVTKDSLISLGLVVSLVIGGAFFGAQINRVDTLEQGLHALRAEFNAHRDGTAHSQSTGR